MVCLLEFGPPFSCVHVFKFGAMVVRSGGTAADFSRTGYSKFQCTFCCVHLFCLGISMVLDNGRW